MPPVGARQIHRAGDSGAVQLLANDRQEESAAQAIE